MLTLIFVLIIGSFLVYISKFNFTPVNLNLGMSVFYNIPLFYVVIGSLLIGLILSYLIQLAGSVSTSYTIRGKNKELKNNKNNILELTRRIHQLELENEKLTHLSGNEPEDNNAL